MIAQSRQAPGHVEFTFAALVGAVSTVYGQEIADRLTPAMVAVLGSETAHDDRIGTLAAGHALALACCPGDPSEGDFALAALVGADLEHAATGRKLSLEPGVATRHPLAPSYLRATLGETLGEMLRIGADMSELGAPQTTVFLRFSLAPDDERSAVILASRGDVGSICTALFGRPQGAEEHPYRTDRSFGQGTILEVGALAFDASPPRPEPRPGSHLRVVENDVSPEPLTVH